MTGFPIVETKANDVSAYIPTNVISITDGQIFLQSDLFNENQRPAVDVGISVSRVGGAAQIPAMKKVSGTLKIELAQYRSLQAFAMFSSDLDATSKAQLERGARLTELLKQPQYSPMAVVKQVVSIWLGTNGHLDSIPVADVKRFESEFHSYVQRHTSVLSEIAKSGDLTDQNITELNKCVDEFSQNFLTSERLASATSADKTSAGKTSDTDTSAGTISGSTTSADTTSDTDTSAGTISGSTTPADTTSDTDTSADATLATKTSSDTTSDTDTSADATLATKTSADAISGSTTSADVTLATKTSADATLTTDQGTSS
jgi:hypothetical protein